MTRWRKILERFRREWGWLRWGIAVASLVVFYALFPGTTDLKILVQNKRVEVIRCQYMIAKLEAQCGNLKAEVHASTDSGVVILLSRVRSLNAQIRAANFMLAVARRDLEHLVNADRLMSGGSDDGKG